MNFDTFANPHTPRLLVEGEGCLKALPNPDYVSFEEELLERFKETALSELGLATHPKREEIWEFAFINGDYPRRGLRWVYAYLEKVSYFVT